MVPPIERIIIGFIESVNAKFPELSLFYEYEIDDGNYNIWHEDSEIDNINTEFRTYVGNLLFEFFYLKDIYNITFGYDYFKSIDHIIHSLNNCSVFQQAKVPYSVSSDKKISVGKRTFSDKNVFAFSISTYTSDQLNDSASYEEAEIFELEAA